MLIGNQRFNSATSSRLETAPLSTGPPSLPSYHYPFQRGNQGSEDARTQGIDWWATSRLPEDWAGPLALLQLCSLPSA